MEIFSTSLTIIEVQDKNQSETPPQSHQADDYLKKKEKITSISKRA